MESNVWMPASKQGCPHMQAMQHGRCVHCAHGYFRRRVEARASQRPCVPCPAATSARPGGDGADMFAQTWQALSSEGDLAATVRFCYSCAPTMAEMATCSTSAAWMWVTDLLHRRLLQGLRQHPWIGSAIVWGEQSLLPTIRSPPILDGVLLGFGYTVAVACGLCLPIGVLVWIRWQTQQS